MSKIYHRKQHVFSILLIWLLVISFPLVLNAEDALVTCTGLDCEFCDLISTGQRVLNWLVGVLTILAVLLFAYAGLILVTSLGNRTFKQKAFTIFNNVIIGYLLVLAGWLLVDTTLKALANQELFAADGAIGPWNRIECVDQPTVVPLTLAELRDEAEPPHDGTFIPADPSATGPLTGSIEPIRNEDGSIDESALASLRAAGVNVAAWEGIDGPGRTDLAHPDVVAAFVWMQEEGRERFGVDNPFWVTSAYSAAEYEAHSPNSQHYLGLAVDFQPVPDNGVTLAQLNQLARDAGFTFVLTEGRHVHADAR